MPPAADRYELPWKKSSRSGETECVEVATVEGMIFVRDSKDPQQGNLCFKPGPWQDFVSLLRRQ
jgi:hypothetical protein